MKPGINGMYFLLVFSLSICGFLPGSLQPLSQTKDILDNLSAGYPDSIGYQDTGTNWSNELHPSWSPSGEHLVFYSDVTGNDELYTFELSTGLKKQLTHSTSSNENPVWSPTGEYIAFQSDRNGGFDLFIVRPDGSGLKQLTSMEEREMSPAWSPDGKSLVYEVDYEGNWQLFTVDIRTGREKQLTTAKQDHLAGSWSRDGKQIFYSRSFRGKHQTDVEIHVMEIETRSTRELTINSSVSSNATISPGSNRMIFNTLRDGNWEIYSMNFTGAQIRRLTESAEKHSDFEFADIDGQPAFSNDGKSIAFLSGRAGSFDICVMDRDGKGFKNLTQKWKKLN